MYVFAKGLGRSPGCCAEQSNGAAANTNIARKRVVLMSYLSKFHPAAMYATKTESRNWPGRFAARAPGLM
jgi:hypothetical protein